jgi:putative NADH-flavin reductase
MEVLTAKGHLSSTLLEEEFKDTLDNTCLLHNRAKHSLCDCSVLKKYLGVPEEPNKL